MKKNDKEARKWLNENVLSYDIWNNKYRCKEESFEEWLDRVSNKNEKIKDLIRKKKFLFGGRILANRGLDIASLANCATLGRVGDSIENIMDVNTKLALTFKAQQGQGVSMSDIRPKNALIKHLYPSEGIIPFMEMFNATTESIQQGGSRRGALLMSLDIMHKDAPIFISIKSDLNKINNANLSLEIDDRFMNAVQECKDENKNKIIHIKKTYEGDEIEYDVDVMTLYKMLCEHSLKYAEPGVLFTDRLFNYNLLQYDNDYIIQSTNACSEQPLIKHGMCMLSSINLSEYVYNPFQENCITDLQSLEEDIKAIVTAMDDIVDENIPLSPLKEQREVAAKYRNIGIGIMGLADYFVKKNIKYGSEESKEEAYNIMRFIFRAAVKASIELGEERGNYPGYKPCVWDSEIIRNNFSFEEIIEMKKRNHLRNCSLLSVAPTGSIGTMLQISTGVEPFFALSYKRRTISLTEGIYECNIPILEEFKDIKGEEANQDIFVTAKDIAWKDRIGVQAALQKACDTAISSTCNLPKKTTLQDVEDIYLEAWRKGCKGFTIYVEGSRNPILSSCDSEYNTFKNGVIKRPKELEADFYATRVKGELFIVLVGLMNNKPYEIFVFRPTEDMNISDVPSQHKGKIIKIKKMHYMFSSKYINIQDLQIANSNIEERASTLYTSMLLRHNVDLKYIIKTAKKVNDNITSFSSAMCRILSKYTNFDSTSYTCPECGNEVIREAGCCKCNVCGWSACE